MDSNQGIMKLAQIKPEDVDSINSCQSKIRTVDNKDVVLIAYEK